MEFDHFLVRPIRTDDLDGYYRLIDTNRPRLEDFFAGTVSKTRDREQTRNFISDNLAKAEKRTYFPFVVVDKTNEEIIGYVDVKSIDWSIPKAELGYFIDSRYEGEGISTKAVAAVTDHCFNELGMNKLFLRTHSENTGSRKVAERNGFEVEGLIRRDYKTTKGAVVDLVYYGRIR